MTKKLIVFHTKHWTRIERQKNYLWRVFKENSVWPLSADRPFYHNHFINQFHQTNLTWPLTIRFISKFLDFEEKKKHNMLLALLETYPIFFFKSWNFLINLILRWKTFITLELKANRLINSYYSHQNLTYFA